MALALRADPGRDGEAEAESNNDVYPSVDPGRVGEAEAGSKQDLCSSIDPGGVEAGAVSRPFLQRRTRTQLRVELLARYRELAEEFRRVHLVGEAFIVWRLISRACGMMRKSQLDRLLL